MDDHDIFTVIIVDDEFLEHEAQPGFGDRYLRRHGIFVLIAAGRDLDQRQFFDISRYGGLSDVESFLAEKIGQFLLGRDIVFFDQL